MTNKRIAALAAMLCAALALAAPAAAQEPTVDLRSQFNVRLDGPAARQFGATSVERAGDVNGDGRADIVVGFSSDAYVVFGGSSPGTVDLAALGSRGFRISGGSAGLGTDVASAGDMNGDGRDDLVIGDPTDASIGGRAWVVFGKASTTPVDLSSLGTGGFRIEGPPGTVINFPTPGSRCPDAQIGQSVDGVGDFNGDGRPDVVVAGYAVAPGFCGGPQGQAYVVFGKASSATVDVGAPQGAAELLGPGTTAAGAGDVNGDGRSDIIVGNTAAPFFSGGAYVRFGGGGGFSIAGPSSPGGGPGAAVAGVGDVNGDGMSDMAVGDPAAGNNGRPFSGSAWVVFGKASTSGVNLGALGTGGYRIDGAAGGPSGFVGDQAGWALDGAGDVNGDGRPDVLVGAPFASNSGRRFSGSAYVVYGKVSTASVDLAALGSGGVRIDGAGGGTPPVPPSDPGTVGDEAGYSVAGAGDVTGDGRPDVLVGAPFADNNARVDSGSAYLVSFGPPDTTAPVLRVPGKVKVAATSPSGARVTYSVAATDDTDSSPTIRCSPASGSTFAIGRTTVTCTATDDAGNSSTASFVVKVKGPRRQIRGLVALVRSFGLPPRAQAALVGPLDFARWALRAGSKRGACLALQSFIHAAFVRSQGPLTAVQARFLIADAVRIRAVLACG